MESRAVRVASATNPEARRRALIGARRSRDEGAVTSDLRVTQGGNFGAKWGNLGILAFLGFFGGAPGDRESSGGDLGHFGVNLGGFGADLPAEELAEGGWL